MLHFWVYLLRCADGRYYGGHTDNLARRTAQHDAGQGSDFSARRRPVTLVWSEVAPSREEALAFERRTKGWGRAKKEALIAGDWATIHELAVSREARASTSLSTNDDVGGASRAPFVLSAVEGRAMREPASS